MNTPDPMVHNDNVKQAAYDVLGFHSLPYGRTPGGFTSALLHSFTVADKRNFDRLAKVYPYHAHAMSMVRDLPNGSVALADWAGLS